MVTWVRTVLVWLLVLALPAQGAAAATMALCGPGHAARTIGHQHEPAMAVQSPRMHPHGHAASPEPHHHAHAVVADMGNVGDPLRSQAEMAGQAQLSNLAPGDQHKCSACASCCSAAAVLSAGLILTTPDFTPTVFMAIVAAVEPFTTAGPDRPPRLPRV